MWNQQIRNGDFSDGTTGWSFSYGTMSAANNICTLNYTATSGTYIGATYSLNIQEHKYLFIISYKSSNFVEGSKFPFVFFETDGTRKYITGIPFVNGEWCNYKGVVSFTVSGWTALGIGIAAGRSGDSIQFKNIQLIDLTQMFGTDAQIAAALGVSVSDITSQTAINAFEAMFPADYYPYNTGELLSFEGESLDTTDVVSGEHSTDIGAWKEAGIPNFNVWDEQWEVGTINNSTGQNEDASNRIRSKNYIQIVAGQSYYFNRPSTYDVYIQFYDAYKNYITYDHLANMGNPFITISGSSYMRFYMATGYGTTYNNDICINESVDWANGRYVPHGQTCLFFPNGLCSAGTVHDDVFATTAIRRIGCVDLGTLNWTKNTNSGVNGYSFHSSAVDSLKYYSWSDFHQTILCSYLSYAELGSIENGSCPNRSIAANTTAHISDRTLWAYDSAYTDAATFKTAMSGVILYYELATSIELPLPQRQDYSYPVSTATTESIQPDNALLSLGWNQLVQNGNFANTDGWSSSNGILTTTNNICTFTCSATSGVYINTQHSIGATVVNHKYYMSANIKTNDNTSGQLFVSAKEASDGLCILKDGINNTFVSLSAIKNCVSSQNIIRFGQLNARSGVVLEVKNIMLIDLTAMYGAGNEPQTVEEFESIFPADYYPYNTGQQLYVYPSQQYYSIPASPSSGETKPFSAPAITTNDYSIGESRKAVRWNQYANNYTPSTTTNNLIITNNATTKQINISGTPSTNTNTSLASLTVVGGHKYFIKTGYPIVVGGYYNLPGNVDFTERSNLKGYGYAIVNPTTSAIGMIQYLCLTTTQYNTTIDYPIAIDLTKMFGAGNEPSDAAYVDGVINKLFADNPDGVYNYNPTGTVMWYYD